jgi:endonuclease/exonuclease/phosphatase family metal-dependent hydrolase
MSAGRLVRAFSAAAGAVMLAGLAGCSVSHDMRTMDNHGSGVRTGWREPGQRGEESECAARVGPVQWIGPQREADRRALADWCAAAGPPEWRPIPDRRIESGEGARALMVVTWNVHVGGGDLPGFLADAFGWDCDAPRPSLAGGPFVLLVQEAFRASEVVPEVPEGARVADRIAEEPPAGTRMDIVHAAERCGLSLLYVPSMRNGRAAGELGRADRGSAILSTLPLLDPVGIELPLEAQRRVVVAATVTGPGGEPLRLASVHLDVAGNLLRVLGTGGSMRVRQAEGLTEALDLLDPDRALPTVVAGDMNTWSASETVILRMLRAYPDSPDPGDGQTRGSWPADHIFFRAGDGRFELVDGSYVILESDYGSDHRPRRFVLRWP